MNRVAWNLLYDTNLFLNLENTTSESLILSSFYKLKLKRYVDNFSGATLFFKNDLTYLDFIKIIELCKKETQKNSFELNISQHLVDYIEEKNIHIEKRKKAGIEIKLNNKKYISAFISYKKVVDSVMKRPLRTKQMWDSFFMTSMLKSANFSVPGSGKTASVLGVYSYLKVQQLVKRILVICPKNAFGSWIDEFKNCFGENEKLVLFNIHAYTSTEQKMNALKFETGNTNLLLINYESVKPYQNVLAEIAKEKTLLVFDEIHRIKRINGEYAKPSLFVAETAQFVIAMTGTPIPNSYSDVYNLLHALFPSEYNDFFNFFPNDLKNPGEEQKKEINASIQPFFCRTTKKQLYVPEPNKDLIIQAQATSIENEIMKILLYRYGNNKLALMIRLLQLESCPKMLLQKLDINEFEYLLDDSLYDIQETNFEDYRIQIQNLIKNVRQSSKTIQCVDSVVKIVQENKPVIIWCIFISSIENLCKLLEEKGLSIRKIMGEVPLNERFEIIEDFKKSKFQVLLTNPHTLAESVSLHTACHDAIYFEYSYNLVHLLQSKDRIHRLGLPENQYTQYYFMQQIFCNNNQDFCIGTEIYDRLKYKENVMLEAIENDILETMPTTKEDLDIIFKKLKL